MILTQFVGNRGDFDSKRLEDLRERRMLNMARQGTWEESRHLIEDSKVICRTELTRKRPFQIVNNITEVLTWDHWKRWEARKAGKTSTRDTTSRNDACEGRSWNWKAWNWKASEVGRQVNGQAANRRAC